MLNNVVLMGLLTHNPETKPTRNGLMVRFQLEVEREGKRNSNGSVDYVDVIAKGQIATYINSYLLEGHTVVVNGHVQSHRYTDKTGTSRTTTEIVADNVYFVSENELPF